MCDTLFKNFLKAEALLLLFSLSELLYYQQPPNPFSLLLPLLTNSSFQYSDSRRSDPQEPQRLPPSNFHSPR